MSFRDAVTVLKATMIGAVDTFGNAAENISAYLGFDVKPKVPALSLHGKVCIVTGANAGIGLATAEELAARGAHVVLACRSRERGEAAAATLRKRCVERHGTGQVNVEFMQVDMASLDSVRAFCRNFNARKLPLHLLVANAGIMSPATRLQTQDGLEMQFQVNFLSHWLMAHELLAVQRERRMLAHTSESHKRKSRRAVMDVDDLECIPAGGVVQPLQLTTARSSSGPAPALMAAPTASVTGATVHVQNINKGEWGLPDGATRVVMLTSLTHHAGIVNWKDMQSTQKYDPFTSYGLSKLANCLTAVELQRRFARNSVVAPGGKQAAWGPDTAVAVHPGVVNTELATNFFKNQGIGLGLYPSAKQLMAALVDTVGPFLLKTTESSAAGVLTACCAPPEQVAGKYMANGKVISAAAEVQDAALAEELWGTAQKLTGHAIHRSLL